MKITNKEVEQAARELIDAKPTEAVQCGTHDIIKAGHPQAEQSDFVVCVKEHQPHRPTSRLVECNDCGIKLWLATDSPQTVPRLCYECALARLNGEETIQE